MNLLAARSLPDHVTRGGLRLKHRALQVHSVYKVEHLFGYFFCLLFAVQANAVHKNVQSAKVRGCVIDAALRLRD